MKYKTILTAVLATASLLPVAASAQSAGEPRQDQREIRRDVHRGDHRDARDDRRDYRQDRRDHRRDDRHADRRDDRRSYRNGHDRPAYVGPRGYAYRPVAVGHRFAPAYYGSRYWVNDYATYRLPRPGASQRWVRYGNDILLIDIRTGRVLRSNNRFFR